MGECNTSHYRLKSYIGDHMPYHVHIFDKNDNYIGRWDIENQRPMIGDHFVLDKHLKEALEKCGYLRKEVQE